jgi:hypothetical protein
VLGLDTLQLDGDLLARNDVCALVNIAGANFAADLVLPVETKIL